MGYTMSAGKPVRALRSTLFTDDELSPLLRSQWQLFLHGQLGRPPIATADQSYRAAARCIPLRAEPASVHSRGNCGIARPPPCHLDPTRGRRRFCPAVALDQINVLARTAARRAGVDKSLRQR